MYCPDCRSTKNRPAPRKKNVIDYFLEKTEEAGELSIYAIAEKTYSSPSTIIRLCKKIGFQGYKDFRKSLLYETALRKESGSKQMEEIRQEDSLEEIVNKVTVKTLCPWKTHRSWWIWTC